MKTILPPRFYFKLFKVFSILMLFLASTNLFGQTSDKTIFRDDFNRITLGTVWQTNNWSIVDESAFNGNGGPLRTTAAYDDSSYIIETVAKGFTNNRYREFRITFGQVNLSNDSTYVVCYTEYLGGTLTLGRSTDNVIYPKYLLDQVAIYPDFNDIQWYKFKIARYKSGLIQVYIDKGSGYGTIPLLEAIDLGYTTLGHFGWREDNEVSPIGFYVDWIGARKPATEKPAIREKPTEDNLITQVSAKSGRSYKVAKLNNGVNAYTDRNYIVTSVPSYLKGASFIQTAMDDKSNISDAFLASFIKKDAVVYIAYDPRATSRPAWLDSWTKTGDFIGTTDPGTGYLEVYSRLIQYGELYPHPLLLGGNFANPASGSGVNYLVAAVERPDFGQFQAEDAFLSGAVIANNHINYYGSGFVNYINPSKDYIEWTINIDVPGIYNLSFGYANAGLTNRPLQVSDNGANISILPFSPSGSWDSWGFMSGPNVFLTSGIHKIRTTAIISSGPNVDYLNLYYLSSSVPPTNTVVAARSSEFNNNSTNNSLIGSHKAYPNPFVESTKIYYTLKEKANVFLSIYSLQGQQLQVLVNGIREIGNYEATFKADKLSAGIYFYRLQTGNEVKVGKLLKE
ncbi:MAG: T9SS type A sorting domain-containing protein [Ginsengibacter sp.]